MDLVDIDNLLDDLESTEQVQATVVPVIEPNYQPVNHNNDHLQRYQALQRNQNKIKVSSVLSSLNDYVDYDEKKTTSTKTQPLVLDAVQDVVAPKQELKEIPQEVPYVPIPCTSDVHASVPESMKGVGEERIVETERKEEAEVTVSSDNRSDDSLDSVRDESVTLRDTTEAAVSVAAKPTDSVLITTVPESETPSTPATSAEAVELSREPIKFELENDATEQDLEKYLDDLETEFDQTAGSIVTEAVNVECIQDSTAVTTTSEEKLEDVEQVQDTKVTSKAEVSDVTETPVTDVVEDKGAQEVTQDHDDAQVLLDLEKQLEDQEEQRQMEMDRQIALELSQNENGEDVIMSVETEAVADVPNGAEAEIVLEEAAAADPAINSATQEQDDAEYEYLISLGTIAPYWVPDYSHETCMQCDQKFSLLKRRHHCRCCGELLCATCCSFRAHLDYMRNKNGGPIPGTSSSTNGTDWPEGRICTKCNDLLNRRDEVLQKRYLAECGIGADSAAADFPIKSVLKKPKKAGDDTNGSSSGTPEEQSESVTTTPTKNVIFSDGIRPGHDEFGEEPESRRRHRSSRNRPAAAVSKVPTQTPSETETIARALNNYKAYVNTLKTLYNPQTQSFLPTQKTQLPPIMRCAGGILPGLESKNDFRSCEELCDFLKAEKRQFLLQKQLYCSVQIIEYDVEANTNAEEKVKKDRRCLNVTSNGMNLVGQPELIILIEINSSYFTNGAPNDQRNMHFLLLLLRRIFRHFNKIFGRIHTDILTETRAQRKLELAQAANYIPQHTEAALYALDNRVVLTPFQYFNKLFKPPISSKGPMEKDPAAGDSDESDNGNHICDKFPFLNAIQQFVQTMELHKITFGRKGNVDFYLDFNAVLYVKSSFQCLKNIILPDRPQSEYLFGLLVKQTEIPWAKLFPLRLLLRFGAEYQLYPWPLFNSLDRKCLYTEFVENSIIHFLADFRNFSFSLNRIDGLYMNMEHVKAVAEDGLGNGDELEQTNIKIYLPKINYKHVEAMINSSSDSILSFFGNFNESADGHLVCIQQLDANKSSGSVTYSTQSLNIETEQKKQTTKTGLNFFILNGALKSATGLKAKMNIIEDGIMVQVLPGIMSKVRAALLEMKDYHITCSGNEEKPCVDADSGETKRTAESVSFIWTNETIEKYPGLISEIDGQPLNKCSGINVYCDMNRNLEANPHKAVVSRSNMSFFGTKSAQIELSCFYMHLAKVILIDEEKYFYLFNNKMIVDALHTDDGNEDADNNNPIDENSNQLKYLNVTNWEVPSVNFLVKLATFLGRTIDRALHKHLAKLYTENYRRVAVRFHFEPDQIVTYEAGGLGTKLPLLYMNDLDMELIPLLHHILELQPKAAGGSLDNASDNAALTANNLGYNLNGDFVEKIKLLQNIQHKVSFELIFDLLVDLP